MATSRPTSTPIPLSSRLIAATIFVLVVLIGGSGVFSTFYTDLLWFRDLGQEAVFWTRIWSEIALGIAFGLASFALIYANLVIARRVRPTFVPSAFVEGVAVTPQQQVEEFIGRVRLVLEPFIGWVVFVVSVFVAYSIGSGMAGEWELFRLALAKVPFGLADPQFGMDVGFFVFLLPALRAVADWLFSTLFVTLVLTLLVHLYDGGIRPVEKLQGIDEHVKAHISVVLALIVAAKAFDYWLAIYELNFSPRGQVIGASFTDVNAQLPAYWILIVIAAVTVVLLMVNIRYRGWRLPIVALGVWIGASVLVGAIYPALIQQLQVAPNELVAEKPYIKRNIEMTRKAWDLEAVVATGFPAGSDLKAQDLLDATSTVQNIRLWDPNVVVDSYKQLQEIRFYYDFNDVDIDRYKIDGQTRQTLISAREMNVEQLADQSKTWLNKHLVYTHGYGVVVSPVNRASSDGLPEFIVKDLPPKSTTDLKVSVPGIYFGEETKEYAIVDTTQKEFDYPVGGENATTSYSGKNGIQVGSLLNRLAFAIRNGDVEILFSTAITDRSRMLYRRTIAERLNEIAPWLQVDADPYPVILDGRIVWVIDGFTISKYYPYSERYSSAGINYIRNSVKVTVDAYDGKTTFYAFDDKDPVLKAYREVFPEMFTDAAKMPAALRAHLRYPETLFRLQAEVYKTYHMLDPQVFYNKEDQWALPGETTEEPMAPYYVLMTLPGETHEDFMLMIPFTPRNKDNMIGWMAAKSDPGVYGQRIVYNFPKQRLVLGPQQIRARLNQEPDISKELTLLNQQGSAVRFGNLLVIPIRDSILYIEPLYIQASQSPMPELKRVIVAYADRIAMDTDLKGALMKVFGAAPAGSETTTGSVPSTGTVTTGGTDLERARQLYDQAVSAQRSGDWAAYGRYIKELGDVLSRLVPSTPKK
ncbi:MAG: UPF0182 family protein [Coriobacteriia bacterium]|nr:UPF0182 family protein [Coriobacteriia bacterium]